jgi:hypothetical protein
MTSMDIASKTLLEALAKLLASANAEHATRDVETAQQRPELVDFNVRVPLAVRQEAKRLTLDHGITLRQLAVESIAAWKRERGVI